MAIPVPRRTISQTVTDFLPSFLSAILTSAYRALFHTASFTQYTPNLLKVIQNETIVRRSFFPMREGTFRISMPVLEPATEQNFGQPREL